MNLLRMFLMYRSRGLSVRLAWRRARQAAELFTWRP